jgi:hypothetical protein
MLMPLCPVIHCTDCPPLSSTHFVSMGERISATKTCAASCVFFCSRSRSHFSTEGHFLIPRLPHKHASRRTVRHEHDYCMKYSDTRTAHELKHGPLISNAQKIRLFCFDGVLGPFVLNCRVYLVCVSRGLAII